MEKGEIKVSKTTDVLDTTKLWFKIGAAVFTTGVTVITGAITVHSCSKDLKLKRSDPDKYWESKRNSEFKASKLIADSIDKLADSLIDLVKSNNN